MKNYAVEKSIELALLIIKYCEQLEKNRKFVISNQLLKAGTSIGASIHEAQMQRVKQILFIKLK